MNRNTDIRSFEKLGLQDLDPRELRDVEGGVQATYDDEGNIIADCEGIYHRLPGGRTIWLPYGARISRLR